MSQVPIGQPVDDPTATLTADIPCIDCGYNLRGLLLEMMCPECNGPVKQSVHGNLLKYSDPKWLARIRLGVQLLLWNILVGVGIVTMGAALSIMGSPAMGAMISLVGAALGTCAVFLITAQEPRVAHQEALVSLRRVMRTCAVVNLLGPPIVQTPKVMSFPMVMVAVSAALAVAGIISYFGQFVYLRRFARRVPDFKLAKSTTVVMWGIPFSYGMMAVGGLIGLAAGVTAMRGGAGGVASNVTSVATLGGAGLFVCVSVAGVVVFSLWALILLYRYNSVLKQLLADARAFAAR